MKNKKKSSEQATLLTPVVGSIVGVLVIIVIIASISFGFSAVQNINQGIAELHIEIGKHARAVIETSFQHFSQVHLALGREFLQHPEDMEETIQISFAENSEFEEISFVDLSGKELIRINRIEGTPVENKDLRDHSRSVAFNDAKSGIINIGPVFLSRKGTPTMTMFAPAKIPGGKVVGATRINLSLKFMWDHVSTVDVGERGRVYVVDNRGTLIADKSTEHAFLNAGQELLFRDIVAQFTNTELKEIDGLDTASYTDFSGREVYAAGVKLDEFEWAIIAEQPVTDAFIARTRTIGLGIILSLAAIVLLTVLTFAFRRLIALSFSLGKEKKHTESIIDNLHDGLIEYAEDGCIMRINPRAETMLGISIKKLQGKCILKGAPLHTNQEKNLLKIFAKEIRRHKKGQIFYGPSMSHTFEVSIETPYSQQLVVSTLPILDSHNEIISGLKIIRDVTEEKLVEKTRRDFWTNATHQLRTPLTIFKWMFAGLVGGEYGKLNEKQTNVIKGGEKKVNLMIDLVNMMLDIDKVEAENRSFNFQGSDFVSLVKIVVKSFKPSSLERNIKITLHSPKEPISAIKFDADKMTVVLENLINNALKYTTKPGTEISVRVRQIDNFVEVSIKDQGIGIPEEEQEKIFKRFYRAYNVQMIEAEGTGLGLYIVKLIVEAHGGKIWLKSKLDEGSTFFFTLPVHRE